MFLFVSNLLQLIGKIKFYWSLHNSSQSNAQTYFALYNASHVSIWSPTQHIQLMTGDIFLAPKI